MCMLCLRYMLCVRLYMCVCVCVCVCHRELGYKVVEVNASDTRNKSDAKVRTTYTHTCAHTRNRQVHAGRAQHAGKGPRVHSYWVYRTCCCMQLFCRSQRVQTTACAPHISVHDSTALHCMQCLSVSVCMYVCVCLCVCVCVSHRSRLV